MELNAGGAKVVSVALDAVGDVAGETGAVARSERLGTADAVVDSVTVKAVIDIA